MQYAEDLEFLVLPEMYSHVMVPFLTGTLLYTYTIKNKLITHQMVYHNSWRPQLPEKYKNAISSYNFAKEQITNIYNDHFQLGMCFDFTTTVPERSIN